MGVLAVPANEELWSPRLRVYFQAISQFHARPKETSLGMLMVTNLSGFPSALTVIPIPDGDTRSHREDFIVNENLKRLGCSGRAGLSLSEPSGATAAKFHQLYKTSDHVKLYSAVIELVKLCQVALMIFGKLEQEYADGLLCDVTEKAINDWWTEFGSEYFNLEPNDGILGPTTVAALLGMLMGARNRLNYYGAPVSKDVFDIASLKRGIAYFQKSQKLERTRRLDRQTLARLHRVTAKAAAGEGWAVPKAVKSTVTELGGKGGEMVMGMIGGGRDKAGIGDIETLDIDRFVSLVHGERSKWLWYGKPRRHGTGDTFGKSLLENGNMVFGTDEQGGYVWSNKRSESITVEENSENRKRDSGNPVYSTNPTGSAVSMVESPGAERDQQLRKTVFKSVTGKMSDARSGFGRIKDAVGLRGHSSRPSKDEGGDYDQLSGYFSPSSANLEPSSAIPTSPNQTLSKTFTWKNKPEEYQNGFRKGDPTARLRDSESPASEPRRGSVQEPVDQATPETPSKEPAPDPNPDPALVKEIRRVLVASDPSVAGSTFGDDLEGPLLAAERGPQNSDRLFFRRHSICDKPSLACRSQNEDRWPRHMSFSDAEEVVLTWDDIGLVVDDGETADTWIALQNQKIVAENLRQLHERLSKLQNELGTWVNSKVEAVEGLNSQAARDQEDFQSRYYQLSDAYQYVQQSSEDVLATERLHLTEAIKEVEVLGARLEYEISALVSKVEDVEDGVAQFESQVEEVELRAAELEKMLKTETWLHWAVRTLTGIGTGPHLL